MPIFLLLREQVFFVEHTVRDISVKVCGDNVGEMLS